MSQLRILVVDDNEAVLNVASKSIRLGFPGSVVDSAKSLETAWALLDLTTYALVVSDLHIGASSGINFYEQLQAGRYQKMPAFVLMTGDAGHGPLPPVPCIYKPFTSSALLSACRAALGSAWTARPTAQPQEEP